MDVSASALATVCSLSTLVIRICSYIFLRWIPGHVFPPIIFTSFLIYASTFAILYLAKSAYEVVTTTTEVSVTAPPEHNGVTANTADNLDTELEETDALLVTGSVKNTKERPVLEATETTIYERRDPHPLKALLLGLPSSMNMKLSLATFLINALLTLATWDLTFRSTMFYPAHDLSFTRIGYVGPHSARLLVREPNKQHWPVTVWYQPDAPGITNTHLVDSIPYLNNETDYTKAITIPKLSPETKYRYFTSSNHSGTFSTAPAPGHPPRDGKFTFLTSSCIKTRFPYSPFDHPLSIPGFRAVKDKLDDLKASFMLFLGDFIYIDVPRRPGSDVESYRQQYRQVYASKDWAAIGDELPLISVVDDHEIANDWDAGTSGVYNAAMDSFKTYQLAVNPPPVRKNGELYYTFEWGSSASFFLLDTRTYRSPENLSDGPEKTMLGEQQLEDLLNWLTKSAPGRSGGEEVQWKFIISSVPFTKNWRFGGNDTWGGYLHERQRILEAAWSITGRSGVVVLSGDRHEFAATAFPPPDHSKYAGAAPVHEFSCSPLSQFYLPVRTYRQTDTEDEVIKYIPDGNIKFGAVTIDTTNEEQAVLKYQLFVDGQEEWSWVLTAPSAERARDIRRHWA